MKRLIFPLLFFVAAAHFTYAASETPPSTDAAVQNRLIEDGLRSLYFLDYPSAEASFRTLTEQFPDSPLGPYATAMSLWWELTNDYDESNPVLEKRFLAAADRAADVARADIKKTDDPTGEAHLCLGGALGLQARWEAIQGEWLSAYRHGKQAFKAQKRAIDINPAAYDAYLGVGIFHYYTATLPAVVKILAKLIFGGNKQQGLDEIRIAMDKGRFSRTAAKLFMVGILVNNEKTPAAAMPLIDEGRKEYAGSPFFDLLAMLVLDEAKDWPALEKEARMFLAKVDKGEKFYDPKYRHRAQWSLGNAILGKGDARAALALYDQILSGNPPDDRWVTMTYLNRGRTHDRLGERDAAVADYDVVMKRRNVWQLHDKASAFLDTPDAP
jgi:tetratricopeptide (TPR) repeat protein